MLESHVDPVFHFPPEEGSHSQGRCYRPRGNSQEQLAIAAESVTAELRLAPGALSAPH